MKNPLTSTIGPFLWVMGLALTIAFSACQKDETEPEPVNLADLPGVNYLGRGYNAFGEFADAGELKSPLLLFGRYKKEQAGGKEYKVPEEADVQQLDQNIFKSISGPTIGEYQNQRALSIGLGSDYPFFSGSVAANFQEIHYRTLNYAFVNVSNEVELWKISLPYDAALLRGMLTEEAKTALASMPATELFSKYGTHVLVSATIGGRADYFVATEKNEATNQLGLAAAAEASFKESLGELDLNAEPQYAEMVNTLREHSFIGLKVQGGSPDCGHNIFSPGNYEAWSSSVKAVPSLSGLSNLSLMPVWELCESSERSTELANAFEQYAIGFNLPAVITNARTCITDILVKTGDNSDPYYYQEAGYKVVPVNLNENTAGDFVYLMYKEGLDVETSISELATVSGVNPTAPVGWFRINANLNEGTGAGDPEIYFVIKKIFSDNPIRQLRVIIGESTPLPTGFEYVRNHYYGNPQNLNQGAGGEAVFLAYSRNLSQP